MKIESLMHPQVGPKDFRLTLEMRRESSANVIAIVAFCCMWMGCLPKVEEVTRVRRRKKGGGKSVSHYFEVKVELYGSQAHGPLFQVPRRLKKGYFERWSGCCDGQPQRIVVEEYYLFKLRQWMGREVWLAFRDHFDIYRMQVVAGRPRCEVTPKILGVLISK